VLVMGKRFCLPVKKFQAAAIGADPDSFFSIFRKSSSLFISLPGKASLKNSSLKN